MGRTDKEVREKLAAELAADVAEWLGDDDEETYSYTRADAVLMQSPFIAPKQHGSVLYEVRERRQNYMQYVARYTTEKEARQKYDNLTK